MKNQITIIIILLVSGGFLCRVAIANPPPPPSWSYDKFAVVQTLEPAIHIEIFSDPDSSWAWVLYGGPALLYTWSPDEYSGFSAGLDIAGAVRKYYMKHGKGMFFSVYLGAGAQWSLSEDIDESAFSWGIKLGYRIPSSIRNIDLEPYLCLGMRLFSHISQDNFPGAFYLGTKIAFF